MTLPTLAAPTWEPTQLLPSNYQPPPGGPTLAELQASPLFRMMQSAAAGAPSSSLLQGWEQNTLPGVLSGAIPLNQPAFDPLTMPAPPSWSTYTAPTPGQPGWVDPVWGSNARPMDAAPPNPFAPAQPMNANPNAVPAPHFPGDGTPPPGWQGMPPPAGGIPPKDAPPGFNPRPGMGNAGTFGGRPSFGHGLGGGDGAPQAPQTPQAPQWGNWGGFGGNSGGQAPAQPNTGEQRNPFSFGSSPWKRW